MDVKKKYKTIEEAEDALDLTLESYLDESEADMRATPSPQALSVSQSLLDKLTFMTPSQLKPLAKESCQLLSKLPTSESNALEEVLNTFTQLAWIRTHVSQSILSEISRVVESVTMLNKCFDIVAKKIGVQTNVLNFPSISLESMKKLQSIGKTNTAYNLSKVISEQTPDGSVTLMPLQRFSDEDLPSFDICPTIDEDWDLRTHPLHLHRLRPNTREDSSIFVAGRAHLPARYKKSIQQSFHKPESILPDPV